MGHKDDRKRYYEYYFYEFRILEILALFFITIMYKLWIYYKKNNIFVPGGEKERYPRGCRFRILIRSARRARLILRNQFE